MPRTTIWLVRAALIHLIIGAGLGALLLAVKAGWAVPPWAGRTWPLHAEMQLLGWMAQLAFGVAYWILPKHASAPVRGPAAPVVTAAVLLNAGVVAAGLGQVMNYPGLVLGGRVAELAAAALFAVNAVPRIKRFGRD